MEESQTYLGNLTADQRLCFRYIDSAILLLPKYKISRLYSPVFSRRGSYVNTARDYTQPIPWNLVHVSEVRDPSYPFSPSYAHTLFYEVDSTGMHPYLTSSSRCDHNSCHFSNMVKSNIQN